jgi:hypothetical protein
LEGWTFSPIVTIQSGRRYSAGISSDLWGANGNRILPGPPRNGFGQPTIGNVDLRISRRFKFSETMNLEVFAEGFNIFNRQNITSVDTRAYNRSGTNLNFDTDFGDPTRAGNSIFRERQIQFAVRFHF